jgi:hypothetical protein
VLLPMFQECLKNCLMSLLETQLVDSSNSLGRLAMDIASEIVF